MNKLSSSRSSIPSSALSKRSRLRMGTPELHKVMINVAGLLVLKPEYEHEDIHYKSDAMVGAFSQKKFEIPDQHPLDEYASNKIRAVGESVQMRVKRVRHGVHNGVAWINHQVTAGTKHVRETFDAVATPAKTHYRAVVSVPDRIHARLEQENRAIKGELELVQLRLAEARLQAREAGVKGVGYSVATGVRIIWALFFILCIITLAWCLDFLVLDLGFDAFEEWLVSGRR